MKWHVHLDREDNDPEYAEEPRYSITTNPKYEGWKTDSGSMGYGLPKELAQWICDVLNKHGKDCPYKMSYDCWEKK